MQRALERGALEEGISERHADGGDGGETAACMVAIDDVLRAAEREESWPRFITVLRARGPELRERMLRLVDLGCRPREEGGRLRRRSLLVRLADVGLGEEPRDLLGHAQRVMGRARGLSYLLDEYDPDEVLLFPRAREHALEGENAAWMYTFALVLLYRVASGSIEVERASTEFAVTLAVEAARDAGAHWATALGILAEDEAA
jgi:hypothetical protein